MTDAPERIWVAPWREGDWSEGDWDDNEGKTLNDKPCIQYGPIDRIEELTKERDAHKGNADTNYSKWVEADAKLAKAVELLKEARQDLEAYVTHDWPKDVHPHYDKKWERDMELCRRIDATLAEIEGEKG
jgi:hypothetical protein